MQRGHNFQMPILSPFNKGLIISFVALFLVNSILKMAAGFDLSVIFSLIAPKFLSGHIYQLAIYPLLGTGLLEVLFDGLILWFIGSELEFMWGRKRYISFLLTSTLGGGALFVLIQLIFFSGGVSYYAGLSGLGGACNALLLAYGILFPDRTLFLLIFPIKAKYFCMILVAMQLYTGFFSPGAVLAWGHLGAMAFGLGFMLAISNPKFKRLFLKKESGSVRKPRKKSHLSLVKDDDDETPPKYWQ